MTLPKFNRIIKRRYPEICKLLECKNNQAMIGFDNISSTFEFFSMNHRHYSNMSPEHKVTYMRIIFLEYLRDHQDEFLFNFL